MSNDTPREDVRTGIAGMLPKLRRFARVITRDVQEADDLVQVTVEKALLRAGQWRPGSRLESWMFGIMKNAWIDELRARRRRGRVEAPEEAGVNVADGSSTAGEIALSVQSAMALLPEEQRLAVALVLVEGLAYKEAAEVLDVPIGTLTSRLARGRETLQALLGGAGEAR